MENKKKNKHLPFIAINVYHSMTLSNADPDLNENSGGSTDLGQKIARIGGFLYPYSPPSMREGEKERTGVHLGFISSNQWREKCVYLS